MTGRYIKLNDNFFIYYFKDPLGCSCIRIVMIIISIIVNFFSIGKMLSLVLHEKRFNVNNTI